VNIGDDFKASCGDKIPFILLVDFKADKPRGVFQEEMNG
jgi:hypothetical protein